MWRAQQGAGVTAITDRPGGLRGTLADMEPITLDIYVDDHYGGCERAESLAAEAREWFASLRVAVHRLAPRAALPRGVVAVPAYVLDGRRDPVRDAGSGADRAGTGGGAGGAGARGGGLREPSVVRRAGGRREKLRPALSVVEEAAEHVPLVGGGGGRGPRTRS